MNPQTWWHLDGRTRTPTPYEIVSSRLLWWPQLGFSVATPLVEWQRRHQGESSFRCGDWEKFQDPAETTYSSYVDRAREREAFVDGLLDAAGSDGSVASDAAWGEVLVRGLAALRFPLHGMQMAASYLGSIAPSGRITIVAAFQSADEMRRVHAIAQRMKQLEPRLPRIEPASRAAWQHDPAWQPLRETIERLLVAFDFGECFAALALVLKPCFDELLGRQLARAALAAGDDLLARLLGSFDEACAWHGAWSAALVKTALASDRRNAAALQQWIGLWSPRVHAALGALRPLLGGVRGFDFDAALASATAAQAALLARAGLEVDRVFGSTFTAGRQQEGPR